MYPIITVFGKDFSMYAIMAIIGMLVAGVIFCRRIKKSGYDDNDAILFLLSLSGGILLGGSLLYAITNLRLLPALSQAKNIKEIVTIFSQMFGGSVFYGGLLGACGAGLLFIKLKKLPLTVYLDNCALFAPLFHGFARVGCFFGGCCYGIESKFGFCATGNTITDIGSVCRFPVQLLESALNFGIAFLIWRLSSKPQFKGLLFYIYLLSYACVRFFDEILRGDAIRGHIGILSTSQWISILIGSFSLFMLLKQKLRGSGECSHRS